MSYVPFKLQNVCVAYCELVTGTCYYTFGYSKDHSVCRAGQELLDGMGSSGVSVSAPSVDKVA
jgi:hypothetical protein